MDNIICRYIFRIFELKCTVPILISPKYFMVKHVTSDIVLMPIQMVFAAVFAGTMKFNFIVTNKFGHKDLCSTNVSLWSKSTKSNEICCLKNYFSVLNNKFCI